MILRRYINRNSKISRALLVKTTPLLMLENTRMYTAISTITALYITLKTLVGKLNNNEEIAEIG